MAGTARLAENQIGSHKDSFLDETGQSISLPVVHEQRRPKCRREGRSTPKHALQNCVAKCSPMNNISLRVAEPVKQTKARVVYNMHHVLQVVRRSGISVKAMRPPAGSAAVDKASGLENNNIDTVF